MKPPKHYKPRHWTSLERYYRFAEGSAGSSYESGRGQDLGDHAWSRRSFLGVMGASMALAGLSGCRKPIEKIVPYVTQPEEIIPGVPDFYATSMPRGESAMGLVVECHEGRPTKIEGNPRHPGSLGANDIWAQAAILGLYDPDRSDKVLQSGAEKSFDDFVTFWRGRSEHLAENGGAGLTILSESFASPTLARLRAAFEKECPRAQWVAWEPVSDENHLMAAERQTGERLRPHYRLDRADVILSLDCDFLHSETEAVSYAHDFAQRRRVRSVQDSMNRLYVAESAVSLTGGMADHRIRVAGSRIGDFLRVLCWEFRSRGLGIDLPAREPAESYDPKILAALAEDLIAAGPKALVAAGRSQPVWVHQTALVLNAALGAVGQTVEYYPVDHTVSHSPHGLQALAETAASGTGIDTLVILGGNPAYDAGAAVRIDEIIAKAAHSVHLSEYQDETSRLCEWHLPRAHFLESWGDTRAFDGTLGIVQPMIQPLHGGIMDCEMYTLLATGLKQRGYDIVRDTWRPLLGPTRFEENWRRVLHEGVWEGEKSSPRAPRVTGRSPRSQAKPETKPGADALEVSFSVSSTYDGRYANNAWLQELPDAVTRLAWGNAALISPQTARELGLLNGDLVRIGVSGSDSGPPQAEGPPTAPVWISPGQADYTVALPLGYGRTSAGEVGNGVGFSAYHLRGGRSEDTSRRVSLTKTGGRVELANVQDYGTQHDRPIVREATFEEYRRHPEFAKEAVEHPPLKSIYPDHDYSRGYQWGMVIDLNACTGCNACVIACQSENNVPVVGEEQVRLGREMHWLRNDRYYVGEPDEPRIVHQPVACQQCENAPCEQVCPVAATSHDSEGLNTMNYNRCIGTRYCSNNCPFKVRRFNFFNYVEDMPETVKMAQNPDVTVRSRGVMEKCTFCLQRIKRAKTTARQAGRKVADGDILTACQQACPSRAIQFGNIRDADSAATALKKMDRNYELLAELNLRPRNSYLARLRNPNPKLEDTADRGTSEHHG